MIGFIIGFVLGSWFGCGFAAVMVMAGDDRDDEWSGDMEGEEDG